MSAILFRRQCVLTVWWVPSHSNFTTHQSHRLRHIHNTLWIYKINWCPVKMVAILRYFQIHFGCQNLHILIEIAKNYVRTSHYLNQAAGGGGGGMHQQIWPGLHTQLPIIYVRETAPAYIHSSRGGGGGNAPARMYVKRPRPTYTIANYLCTWNLICFSSRGGMHQQKCTWNGPGLHTQLPIIYVRETLSASALDLLKVDPQQLTAGGANAPARFGPPRLPSPTPHGPHTTPPTAPSTALTLPHQPPPPRLPAPAPTLPSTPSTTPSTTPPRHPTPPRPAPPPQPPAPALRAPHPPPRPALPPRLVSRFPHRIAGLGAHIPTKMAPAKNNKTPACYTLPPGLLENPIGVFHSYHVFFCPGASQYIYINIAHFPFMGLTRRWGTLCRTSQWYSGWPATRNSKFSTT